MKIKIFGEKESGKELKDKVKLALDELGLSNFIKLEETNSENIKDQLNIKKEPALIIEEENINFIDTIFEGIIPDEEEIKSMLISIVGGNSGSCEGNCNSGCSC